MNVLQARVKAQKRRSRYVDELITKVVGSCEKSGDKVTDVQLHNFGRSTKRKGKARWVCVCPKCGREVVLRHTSNGSLRFTSHGGTK